MKIKLIDSVMGTGKTTHIMKMIHQWHTENKYDQFIYVSPNLSEVGGEKQGNNYQEGRIQNNLPALDFRYPIHKKGSKKIHAKELITSGYNVSTTHALFTNLTAEEIEDIKDRRNVLIIDEAVNALDQITNITPLMIQHLLKAKQLLVDDSGKVKWNHRDFLITEKDRYEFKDLIVMCDNDQVYLLDGKAFVWEFPLGVLSAFDEVYVLTYMFEGSVMKCWCDYQGVEVEDVTECLNLLSEEQVKQKIKTKIKIVDSKNSNKISNFSMSQSWWHTGVKECDIELLKKTLRSVTKHDFKDYKVKDILITCPKENWFAKDPETGKANSKLNIKGQGYSRATWLASQCRATNDYADKKALIYLLNKHPHVMINKFCTQKGFPIDRDAYALSEMLQWLWRGCIRKEEDMVIYIANKRMKDLFVAWLNK